MFEKERERRREESRKKAEEKNRLIQRVLVRNKIRIIIYKIN